ncbi:hypothetical protein [uncultured Devosia sp.]|uniref:hypothetical protein n=1 Tax=uncultured Devosia sp. TaxID=211434 RepID=UPI0035CBE143
MTHQSADEPDRERPYRDIVAADETEISAVRHVLSGVGGLLALLGLGLVVLLMVLWKAP